MLKCKKIPETSLDLTPLFKTSVDARVEGLVSNVGYLVIPLMPPKGKNKK